MPYDLATAKRAAQQVGATPPPNYPGGPDKWAMDWFQAGVNAGDARLLRIADPNARIAEGGGANDLITDWRNAAPSSEWMGKRMPTAPELRRYYKETGKSEDLDRYGDRVVSDWLKRGNFDYKTGTFAGGVEKPTETGGVLAPQAGGGGGGGGGMPGGGGGYGGWGGWGGSWSKGPPPSLTVDPFKPPDAETVLQDPGYQFRLNQGMNALQSTAAGKGTVFTGGNVKDITDYSQGVAAQEYQGAFDRAAQAWQANLGGKQAQWQSQYAPWQMGQQFGYGAWTTQQQAALQKYLQKEGETYGLLNQPMPGY